MTSPPVLLGFPGGAESTPQSDVNCQLDALEARQILRQNREAPHIDTPDAQVHVTQESVELHPPLPHDTLARAPARSVTSS